jgi:hypothetical protein
LDASHYRVAFEQLAEYFSSGNTTFTIFNDDDDSVGPTIGGTTHTSKNYFSMEKGQIEIVYEENGIVHIYNDQTWQ